MKKITLLILLNLLVLHLGACTQDDNKTLEKNDVLWLSLGHDLPEQSTAGQSLIKWDSTLNHLTQGKLRVKIFHNQQAGNDQIMINKVLNGELDLTIPPTSKFSHISPKIALLDIPYLFEDEYSLDLAFENDLGHFIHKELKLHELKFIGYFHTGEKYITSSAPLSEFEGKKIRVMRSPILTGHYKKLGFKPLSVDFHQVKNALLDGTIHGQENPLISIYNMKFYEHQKYLYRPKHSFLSQILVSNLHLEKKIGPSNWKLLTQTFKDIQTFHNQQLLIEKNYYLDKLSQVLTYEDSVSEKFKFSSFEYRDSILSQNLDFKSALENSPSENDYILALDLALSGISKSSGVAITAGVEMALEDFPQKLFQGKKIRVKTWDNGGFPNRGLANLDTIIQEKNLLALMTGMHSPIALKQLDKIHQNKIPFLVPWAAATKIIDKKNHPFNFRLSVRDEFAGEFLVQKVTEENKKNIAVVIENSAWGVSNKKSIGDALAHRGMRSISVDTFNWGANTLKDILQRIKSSEADAIIFVGNSLEGIQLIKDMHQLNLTIPVYSHWGITGGVFFDEVKKELETVELKFLQTFTIHNQKSQERIDFKQRLLQKLNLSPNDPITAAVGAIHAYELTTIFLKNLSQLEIINGPNIQKSLQNFPYHKGLFKSYKNPFLENHEALTIKDFSLCQFDADGRIIEK